MAYNAIASGSAILTTNADGLKAGLERSAKDIDGWGKEVSGGFGKSFGGGGEGGMGKGIGGAIVGQLAGLTAASGGLFAAGGTVLGGVIGTAVGGPIGSAIGGAIGGALGGLVGDTGGKIFGAAQALGGTVIEGFGAAKDTLADMAKQGDIAKALGLTAEQFTGVAGVAKSAGEGTKEFIESLVTMGKLGADAAKGTEQASAAFKGMGLNAKEFIQLRPDEQFFKVFDSLNQMGASSERTRLLMDAFGEDGGKALQSLLGKAPGQLREMAKGFEISSEEMKKAQATIAAFAQFQGVGDKLWRSFAVVAAGPLEGIANLGSRALQAAQPLFDELRAGADRAWKGAHDFFVGVGTLADRLRPRVQPLFDWLAGAWDGVKLVAGIAWDGIVSLVVPAVEEIVTWVEKGMDAVKNWAGAVFGVASETVRAKDVVIVAFRMMGTAAAQTWDVMKFGAGAFVLGLGNAVQLGLAPLIRAFQSLVDLAKELPEEIRPSWVNGLSDSLGRAADATAAIGSEMTGWGKTQIASFGDTATQFNKWLDEMLRPKPKAADLFGLASGAAGAILQGAAAPRAKIEDMPPIVMAPLKLSGAISKGSQEAYSLVLKNQLGIGGGSNDPAKKQLDEQKKANLKLNKIAAATNDAAQALGKIGVI